MTYTRSLWKERYKDYEILNGSDESNLGNSLQRNSSKWWERPIQKVLIVLAPISESPVAHKLVFLTAPPKTVATVEMNLWRNLVRQTTDRTDTFLQMYWRIYMKHKKSKICFPVSFDRTHFSICTTQMSRDSIWEKITRRYVYWCSTDRCQMCLCLFSDFLSVLTVFK